MSACERFLNYWQQNSKGGEKKEKVKIQTNLTTINPHLTTLIWSVQCLGNIRQSRLKITTSNCSSCHNMEIRSDRTVLLLSPQRVKMTALTRQEACKNLNCNFSVSEKRDKNQKCSMKRTSAQRCASGCTRLTALVSKNIVARQFTISLYLCLMLTVILVVCGLQIGGPSSCICSIWNHNQPFWQIPGIESHLQ